MEIGESWHARIYEYRQAVSRDPYRRRNPKGQVMRVGQTRKRDAAEKAIVAALRAVGAHVTPISGKGAPDLLIRFRGRLWAFEVKSPTGTLTEAQALSEWPIIRTVGEALATIGIVKKIEGDF